MIDSERDNHLRFKSLSIYADKKSDSYQTGGFFIYHDSLQRFFMDSRFSKFTSNVFVVSSVNYSSHRKP